VKSCFHVLEHENRTPGRFAPRRRGFTLIELLVVVGLVGILAAVSADLFSSILRAYSKAQIINEIEQNGNAVLSHLGQQIRNAASVSPEGLSKSITVVDQDGGSVVFSFENSFSRDAAVQIGVVKKGGDILTNHHSVRGVDVVSTDSYFDVSTEGGMQTVKIFIKIRQAPNAPARFDYQAETALETTVVVRGGYQ